MNNELFEKIALLLEDKDFVAEISGKTLDETLKAFAAHGLNLTEDELHSFYEYVNQFEDELDETTLDMVAGGKGAVKKALSNWWTGAKATAKGLWDGFWGL